MIKLKKKVLKVIKRNKHEILHQGDWWYNLKKYSLNIYEREPDLFYINLYLCKDERETDYSEWINFKPMSKKDIKKL